jgi:hypothetical protein
LNRRLEAEIAYSKEHSPYKVRVTKRMVICDALYRFLRERESLR